MLLPDDPGAREQIEETLRTFVAEGVRDSPDSKLAKQLEAAIEYHWCDQPLAAKERVSILFRKAFGIEEVHGDDYLVKPQEDFESVVGGEGWFGDFLAYTRPAKAMPQLFFGAAVAFIAAGLGRQPRIEWSVEGLFPNVYVLLVGDTGAGKGTAVKRAQKIVLGGMAPHILPSEGSHQGYADALKRRFEETGTHADGLIVAEELRMLLSDEKYKAQLVTWLTAWYSHEGPWSRALRSEDEYEFENPCVSCLFASNMTWLRQVPGDAVLGGFFPRFLKFHTPENQMRWGTFMPKFDDAMAKSLSQRLAEARARLPEVVKLSKESLVWANLWYDSTLRQLVENESHERMKDWANRCSAHLMKLACIWQFADGELKGTLHLRWLRKAWRVLEWMRYTVSYVYGSIGLAQHSTILMDVLARLEASDGIMTVAGLNRSLRNRYRAPEVRAAAMELESAGDIVRVQDPRRGICWALAKRGRNGEVGK